MSYKFVVKEYYIQDSFMFAPKRGYMSRLYADHDNCVLTKGKTIVSPKFGMFSADHYAVIVLEGDKKGLTFFIKKVNLKRGY